MKRVLFDENMPRKLRRHLAEFTVRTVQEEGWAGLENGALLRRAEGTFDVFVTADRRMQFQQSLPNYAIGVVVITTPRLWYRVLITALPQLIAAIESVQPRQIMRIQV